MTYLLQLLLVVSVVYWTSLLIAELVLTSASEQRLALPVRIGLGYLLLVAFFAAAFKLVSIQIAWALGAGLLALFLIARPRGFLAERWHAARSSWRSFVRWYLAWLLLANVFWLPLHLTRTYGPFTEGGGDVSIYADVTKYLVDHQLAVWGPDQVLYELRQIGRNLEAMGRLQIAPADNLDSLADFDLDIGNAPHAEYSAYRVANVQRYSSVQFSPTAQWFFLFGQTNYPVFFGVLAFQYAVMLLAMAAALRRFGRLPAALAFGLGIASHGLIAVPFNMYFLQSLCLMLIALVIAALAYVPLLSWAGLRTYGLTLAVMATSYLHFVSVLLPFLLARPFQHLAPKNATVTIQRVVDPLFVRIPKSILGALVALAIIALVGVWFVADGMKTLNVFVAPTALLIISAITHTPLDSGVTGSSPFYGDAIRQASRAWVSFFLGIASQQHYPPFFVEFPQRIFLAVALASILGGVALLAGGALMVVAFVALVRRRLNMSERQLLPGGLALYVVSLLVIGLHIVLTQGSLYLQAKGAQDVLVVLYIGILAVPAMLANWQAPPMLRRAAWGYGALVAGFIVALVIPRAYFAWDLANGKNRSTIIEPSYFAEAARIRQTDPSPFVLMEPDVNSDIYLTIQPFFGARLLPTRHLSLSRIASTTRVDNGAAVTVQVDRDLYALDFVRPEDLDHLWTLEANTTEHPDADFPMPERERVWTASRVAETTHPLLLLASNYYERFFTSKPRSATYGDMGWFTYLRGGTAGVVVPAGAPASYVVSLRIRTESPEQLAPLAAEISTWLDQTGSPEHDALTQDAENLTLTYYLTSGPRARLVPLVRAKSTYLLNMRIDDIELMNARAEVSAPPAAHPGQTLEVIWRGLDQPRSDDWVAVFPVDGAESTRVIWQPTGGAAAGSLGLPLPDVLAPGQYELRLYAHGSWSRVATTTFDVTP